MSNTVLQAIQAHKDDIHVSEEKRVVVPSLLDLYCEDGMSYNVTQIVDELKNQPQDGWTDLAKEQLELAIKALTAYNNEVLRIKEEAEQHNYGVNKEIITKREAFELTLTDVPEKRFTHVLRVSKSKLSPEIQETLQKVYKQLGFTHVASEGWRDFVYFVPEEFPEIRKTVSEAFEELHSDKSFLIIRNYLQVENNSSDLEYVLKSRVQ